MTVGNLKALLKDIPDPVPILIVAPDHSLCWADVVVGTALGRRGEFTQDHGEDCTPESEYGPRFQALIIS